MASRITCLPAKKYAQLSFAAHRTIVPARQQYHWVAKLSGFINEYQMLKFLIQPSIASMLISMGVLHFHLRSCFSLLCCHPLVPNRMISFPVIRVSHRYHFFSDTINVVICGYSHAWYYVFLFVLYWYLLISAKHPAFFIFLHTQ
jgi:predicted neutral ceramidase superfamily lipid hydrolase